MSAHTANSAGEYVLSFVEQAYELLKLRDNS